MFVHLRLRPAEQPGPANLGAFPVAFLVLVIGLALGGTTGYAINPARDLGPRIAHFVLPIPGKRDSDWGYAPIPVVGPLIGAALAYFVYNLAFTNYIVKIMPSRRLGTPPAPNGEQR